MTLIHWSPRLRSPRGAVLVYLAAAGLFGAPLVVLMATTGRSTASGIVVLFMFVPALSAVCARQISRQSIHLGTPDPVTLLAALVPALAVTVAYVIGSAAGVAAADSSPEPKGVGVGIALASTLAFGEELGWRGYLLPQLRREHGYLAANAGVTTAWFAYHVPVVMIPGLYSNPGIPLWASLGLFGITIAGFSLYVGILWERSHDVWAATLAHGSWNHVVQSALAVAFVSGDPWLLGEFGILAALAMALLFAATVPIAARRYAGPRRSW